MNKYEKAINDKDLVGLYKVWDQTTVHALLFDQDLEYAAHLINELFLTELKYGPEQD
jgi:hypothetical protein